VGDHDLVNEALSARGLDLDFWKIAMRPGKPLMFGKLENQFVIGLPGNPVSSYICALVFLVPLLRSLLGFGQKTQQLQRARLASDIQANGMRQHYMRAKFVAPVGDSGATSMTVTPYESQDSARLALLHEADCLIVREVNAPALLAGSEVDILVLD